MGHLTIHKHGFFRVDIELEHGGKKGNNIRSVARYPLFGKFLQKRGIATELQILKDGKLKRCFINTKSLLKHASQTGLVPTEKLSGIETKKLKKIDSEWITELFKPIIQEKQGPIAPKPLPVVSVALQKLPIGLGEEKTAFQPQVLNESLRVVEKLSGETIPFSSPEKIEVDSAPPVVERVELCPVEDETAFSSPEKVEEDNASAVLERVELCPVVDENSFSSPEKVEEDSNPSVENIEPDTPEKITALSSPEKKPSDLSLRRKRLLEEVTQLLETSESEESASDSDQAEVFANLYLDECSSESECEEKDIEKCDPAPLPTPVKVDLEGEICLKGGFHFEGIFEKTEQSFITLKKGVLKSQDGTKTWNGEWQCGRLFNGIFIDLEPKGREGVVRIHYKNGALSDQMVRTRSQKFVLSQWAFEGKVLERYDSVGELLSRRCFFAETPPNSYDPLTEPMAFEEETSQTVSGNDFLNHVENTRFFKKMDKGSFTGTLPEIPMSMLGVKQGMLFLDDGSAFDGIYKVCQESGKIELLQGRLRSCDNEKVWDGDFVDGVPALGVKGIALATVIVELLGTVYILWFVIKEGFLQGCRFEDFLPKSYYFKALLKQSMPSSLNMMAIGIGFFVINFFLKEFSDEALAAFGIGTRIQQIFLLPTIGLSIATLSIVGQNNGAKLPLRIYETILITLRLGAYIAFTGMLVMLLFGKELIMLFSRDPNVIEIGRYFLISAAFSNWGYMVMGVYNSTLQGIKHPNFPFYMTFIRQIILPLLLFPLLIHFFKFGIASLWVCIVLITLSVAAITRLYTIKRLQKIFPFHSG